MLYYHNYAGLNLVLTENNGCLKSTGRRKCPPAFCQSSSSFDIENIAKGTSAVTFY